MTLLVFKKQQQTNKSHLVLLLIQVFLSLTCMSLWVMKPLLSMSQIWKNSWVFSRMVLCPTCPFSLFLPSLWLFPAPPLLPSLCRALWATVAVLVSVMAQGAVKAAMVFVKKAWLNVSVSSVLHMSPLWRSLVSGCCASEAFTNVTDSHLLATTPLISRWKLGKRQEDMI